LMEDCVGIDKRDQEENAGKDQEAADVGEFKLHERGIRARTMRDYAGLCAEADFLIVLCIKRKKESR